MGNSTVHGLKPEVINELESTTELSSEQIRRLYREFCELSDQGTWTAELNPSHLVALYEKAFLRGGAGRFARRLFVAMDTDGSGSIDFREFALTSNVHLHGDEQQRLRWLFGMFDTQRTGIVRRQELVDVVQTVLDLVSTHTFGEQVTAEIIASEILEALDSNGDERLTLKEFLVGGSSCPTLRLVLREVMKLTRRPFSSCAPGHRPRSRSYSLRSVRAR